MLRAKYYIFDHCSLINDKMNGKETSTFKFFLLFIYPSLYVTADFYNWLFLQFCRHSAFLLKITLLSQQPIEKKLQMTTSVSVIYYLPYISLQNSCPVHNCIKTVRMLFVFLCYIYNSQGKYKASLYNKVLQNCYENPFWNKFHTHTVFDEGN